MFSFDSNLISFSFIHLSFIKNFYGKSLPYDFATRVTHEMGQKWATSLMCQFLMITENKATFLLNKISSSTFLFLDEQ